MISHLWPGITPFNVLDLTYGDFLAFADMADAHLENRKKEGKSWLN